MVSLEITNAGVLGRVTSGFCVTVDSQPAASIACNVIDSPSSKLYGGKKTCVGLNSNDEPPSPNDHSVIAKFSAIGVKLNSTGSHVSNAL